MKCIAAFTDSDIISMPPYINVSQAPDGLVRVIVRGEGVPAGVAGPGTIGEGEPIFQSPEATITMTEEQWYEFLRECNAFAAQKRRAENEAAEPKGAA